MATLEGFEIGKSYKHTSGAKLHIVGMVQTHIYGLCLVGEDEEGQLKPIGIDRGATENWTKIKNNDSDQITPPIKKEEKELRYYYLVIKKNGGNKEGHVWRTPKRDSNFKDVQKIINDYEKIDHLELLSIWIGSQPLGINKRGMDFEINELGRGDNCECMQESIN